MLNFLDNKNRVDQEGHEKSSLVIATRLAIQEKYPDARGSTLDALVQQKIIGDLHSQISELLTRATDKDLGEAIEESLRLFIDFCAELGEWVDRIRVFWNVEKKTVRAYWHCKEGMKTEKIPPEDISTILDTWNNNPEKPQVIRMSNRNESRDDRRNSDEDKDSTLNNDFVSQFLIDQEIVSAMAIPIVSTDGTEVTGFILLDSVEQDNKWTKDDTKALRGISDLIIGTLRRRKAITEYASLQKQFRQSQKMELLGTLAGGIAHDFNNILSGIMGYTDLALDKVPEHPKVRNYLVKVLAGCNRAKDLTGKILSFSRKSEINDKAPCVVTDVVKEAISLLKVSKLKGIEVKQEADSDEGRIFADATQIHQVISNLATNAGQAMAEFGGTLTVKVRNITCDASVSEKFPRLKKGKYISLEVNDTGMGIPAASLEKIFDPYFTTKKKAEGTGLGLSTVHGIVKNHGGEIFVDSEEGVGTTFEVFFPCIEEEQ